MAKMKETMGVERDTVETSLPKRPLAWIVMAISGCGTPVAEKLVENMKPDEKAELEQAYETGQPRTVLASIQDRIADEKRAAAAVVATKAADQLPASGTVETL